MVWEVVVPARDCAWWYLRFSLSLRDVEELMAERGLSVNHNTVWRWTQTYAIMMTPSAISMRSAVSANASEIRQPVCASVPQNVRICCSDVSEALMKLWRSRESAICDGRFRRKAA